MSVRDEKLAGAAIAAAADRRRRSTRPSCARSTRAGEHRRQGSARVSSRKQGVADRSRTETFVALQVFIDNWRWAGVPFFLRTGKRLPERSSEITIQLKEVPPILFNADRMTLEPNVLTIRLQPDEGFSLGISSKVPGPQVVVQPVLMDFDYSEFFKTSSPEAYERLLLDVMVGDATLFMRRDSVETSWRWLTPLLDRWAELGATPLPTYRPASGDPRKRQRSSRAPAVAGGRSRTARDGQTPKVYCLRCLPRPCRPCSRVRAAPSNAAADPKRSRFCRRCCGRQCSGARTTWPSVPLSPRRGCSRTISTRPRRGPRPHAGHLPRRHRRRAALHPLAPARVHGVGPWRPVARHRSARTRPEVCRDRARLARHRPCPLSTGDVLSPGR